MLGEQEIALEILQTRRGTALCAERDRVEGAEEDDLGSRPRDGDVEAALAAAPIEGPEVERYLPVLSRREGHGEQDRVPFISLDVLEVLDEDSLGCVERGGDPRVIELAQAGLDEVSLLDVERYDPNRRTLGTSGTVIEPAPDLLDDGLSLRLVRAIDLARLPTRDASHEVSIDMAQADAEAVGAVILLSRHGTRERGQPALVVRGIGEGDEGLDPAAVVPGQPEPWNVGGHALAEDRLLVDEVVFAVVVS